jgi:hypothetical protein
MITMTEQAALQAYDEMLDEVYGDVFVASYSYNTSYLLKEVDPIAYRVGFSDWQDSEDVEVSND